MKLALAVALSLSMPVPALAASAACAPEPVSREAWPVVMPRMTLAEAEAGLRAAGIVFESGLAYDKTPKLMFVCGVWRGLVTIDQKFPDVEWRVEKIDFMMRGDTRDEALVIADKSAFVLGAPDRIGCTFNGEDGRLLSSTSIEGASARSAVFCRDGQGQFVRTWQGPTASISVSVVRIGFRLPPGAKDPRWAARISYERNSRGQD